MNVQLEYGEHWCFQEMDNRGLTALHFCAAMMAVLASAKVRTEENRNVTPSITF
jgi:hypothetical protein